MVNSDPGATQERLDDRYWRLNNLYWILDKDGERVKFKFNLVQEDLYANIHGADIILKSRQHGVTTFYCILMLDNGIFHPDFNMGIIADNLDDGKEFIRTKIKYPYSQLTPRLRNEVEMVGDAKDRVEFSNGSSIWVDTSMRSATVQMLLISEFGKICVEHPEVAREIVTGSLNAIKPGNMVAIESTAKGRDGYFFNYCERARKKAEADEPLTSLDFKFHFFAWYLDPVNSLSDLESEITTIPDEMTIYFNELETDLDIILDLGQRAWYVKQQERQGDDMKQEHPSTPEEAWEQTLIGNYYRKEFQFLRKESRITDVPHERGIAVDTWWDLGIDDETVIWFTQSFGREIRVIDYYANSGEGLMHYAELLKERMDDRGYRYGKHVGPHDIKIRSLTTGTTRLKSMEQMGISMSVAPLTSIENGIEAVRRIMGSCWFDKKKCNQGLLALEEYRKEYNLKLKTPRKGPLHNWASHAADAFRTFAVAHKFIARGSAHREVEVLSAAAWD